MKSLIASRMLELDILLYIQYAVEVWFWNSVFPLIKHTEISPQSINNVVIER